MVGKTSGARGDAVDADADIDRTADIPLGVVRPSTRPPRDKPSTSSLGSSTRPPSQRSHRPDVGRRLAHIPDADDTPGSASHRSAVAAWLATDAGAPAAAPASRTGRTRQERAPSAASHRHRADDTASVRERISHADRAEVLSAKALSSSSRLLWPGRTEHAPLLADAGPDAAKTWERVAHWRERHAHAPVGEGAALSLRKSTSFLQGAARAAEAPAAGLTRRTGPAGEAAPTPARRQAPAAAWHNADSPLRNVLRWLGEEDLAWAVGWLGLGVLLLVKALVALGGYSGRATPPMYGDLEAQRHWMELTLHLPPRQWYTYDLPYWGLDYPPLTAWVSWACGWVATRFAALRPSFALHTSRGAESPALIVFLRASVWVLEALVYVPAVNAFVERRLAGRSSRARDVARYTVLLQPALLLVDHGHFQYNSVMLGLSTLSFALLYSKLPNVHVGASGAASGDAPGAASVQRMLLDSLSRQISYEYVLAAVFFSLSLCFKQMALYYAPAVFAIMLGRCVGLARTAHPARGAWLLGGLAAATTAVFLVAFLPWVQDAGSLRQCLVRIFPLERGLFEDKVANVWCALSVLPVGRYKLHRALGVATLAKLSLGATLAALLPGCVLLFRASIATVRLELIHDDAQAAQVVERVRQRSGTSVASGRVTASQHARSVRESVAAQSAAASAHESSRGSDRRSTASGSLLAGSTSTWVAGGAPRPRPVVPTPAAAPRAPSASLSPAAALLPYTLLSTSLAFFLLGFQTHEKSVLLPLLPLTLLMTTKGDRTGAGAAQDDWEWAVLANNAGMFGYVRD
ncbi:hypothetical protein CBS9595_003369 [Malassezia furfur]|nr:hypothetical protein CBS9595_003369 [Malassezia furfur]